MSQASSDTGAARKQTAPQKSVARLAKSLLGPLAEVGPPAWADVIAAAGLAVAGFLAVLFTDLWLGAPIQHISTWDYWFESDPARVVQLADDRFSGHHHSTAHHPLFSIVIFPFVFVLKAVGLSLETALAVVLGSVAAAFFALVFTTLRLLGVGRIAGVIFTVFSGALAATIFWFPVPETFSFGALSIIAVMAFAALVERAGGAPFWTFVAAGVVAMSMTTTNWLVALAVFLVFLGWKKGAHAAFASFLWTLALWAVQFTFFPSAQSFLNVFRRWEIDYLAHSEALGVAPRLFSILSHSVVMPVIGEDAYGYRLSVQAAWPGEGGILTAVGVGLWAILLGLGAWGAWLTLAGKAGAKVRKTLLVLLLATAGQIAVCVVFGLETFLYTAHMGPLLVLIAAFGLFTPAPRAAVAALAAVLAVVAGVNNADRLKGGAELVAKRYESRREFAELFADTVGANETVVCGIRALGKFDWDRDVFKKPAEPVNHRDHAHTCTYMFGKELLVRQGWLVWYEDWSLEMLEAARLRGATYFVTSYEYGLQNSSSLFDTLDQRYQKIVRTPQWAIYRLQPAATPAGGSPS